MTNDTTPLSIVKELRRLAENPSHREYLLRNDVNSILIFVDPDEHPQEVVTEAIHALYHLAEEASDNHVARRSLRNTLGLMELMKKIEQREGYAINCKAIAIKIQQLLNNNTLSPISSPNADSVVTRAAGVRSNQRALKFLGGNKKAKIITLQIAGLNDQGRRQQCVDELVRVKGVISLTFNMALQRCIVRAKADLSAETLAAAVRKTKVMEASQIVKNEAGEEMSLPLDAKMDDSTGNLPPYLDDDGIDTPVKEDHAIARPGSGTFGLMAGSWFGSVISAVNKNLYW